jgi:hypothetical protein
MALTKCSECGKEVSTKADKCPHCGAPVKKKTSGCALIVAVLFGVILLTALLPTCSPSSSGPSATATTDAETRIAAYNAAKAKFDSTIEQKYTELVRLVKAGDNAGAVRILRQFENFKKTDYKDVRSFAAGIHTAELVEKLGKLAETDIKGRAETYSELAKLHPENQEYATQATKFAEAWKQEQVAIAAREKKAAEERAAKAAEEAKIASRRRAIEQQFSAWDGSHVALERIIKKSMNNPDSYKHVETKYGDMGDYILVSTTFRGTNAFGGVVTNTVRAKFTLSGDLIEIVSQ